MTLNGYSLDKMLNVLESDYKCIGIDIKTIWLLRMKLIYAMANIFYKTRESLQRN